MRGAGLRVQILIALSALMLLAFLPLFFAVASVTRATSLAAQEQAARALARSAAIVLLESDTDRSVLQRQVDRLQKEGSWEELVIFDSGGRSLARSEGSTLTFPRAAGDTAQQLVLIRRDGARGSARLLETTLRRDGRTLRGTVRIDDDTERQSAVIRLVALYMAVFALALLVFASFVLTRIIVRPVEALGRAADRVASGARALELPVTGARELAELGRSVQAMTARLVADEHAMRSKVEELTHTTRLLTETRFQLAESDRLASVGRLAAGVAHEIGNPLAALMGMQDLLLEGDLPPETQIDFLQRMKRETERIHGIVRDLLDFARPERAPREATPRDTKVHEAAKDAFALVSMQKGYRDIDLSFEGGGDLAVAMSAEALRQVLLNVALNAAAALRAGGKPRGKLVVRAKREADSPKIETIRIEIEDDGPGVSPEVRDRLFEPFVTTAPEGAGTGLGLAVCRGLVESAGGTIRLDLTYVEGARFVIILPAA